MSRLQLTQIVAIAQNGVIGASNALPWHLPEDLRHFKSTTWGHTVVMGRHTFLSLPKTLPNRKMVVISQSMAASMPHAERGSGLILYPSWVSAWESLQMRAKINPAELIVSEVIPTPPEPLTVFVIGGGRLYAETLPLADRLIVTEIQREFIGDVRFPEFPINRENWREHSRQLQTSDQGMRFDVVDYRRRAA